MNQDEIKKLAEKYIELKAIHELAGIELAENSPEWNDPNTFYSAETIDKLLHCQKDWSVFEGFLLALEIAGIADNELFEKEAMKIYESINNETNG